MGTYRTHKRRKRRHERRHTIYFKGKPISFESSGDDYFKIPYHQFNKIILTTEQVKKIYEDLLANGARQAEIPYEK